MADLTGYLNSIIRTHKEDKNEIKLTAKETLAFCGIYLENNNRGVHRYQDGFCIIFQLAGSSLLKIGDHEITLQAGNSLLVDHAYQVLVQRDAVLVKIKFADLTLAKIDQEIMATSSSEQKLVQSIEQTLANKGYLMVKATGIMRSATALEEVIDEYLKASVFAAALIKMNLEKYIIYSLRDGRFSMKPLSQAKFAGSSLDAYIDEHFVDINLNQAAKHFGFNSNYFSNLVKKETGKSFVDHVDERRMQEARQLLAQPNVSLKEIIKRVGFSSKSFFYKKFNQYYGMTPAAMRKDLFRQANINLK